MLGYLFGILQLVIGKIARDAELRPAVQENGASIQQAAGDQDGGIGMSRAVEKTGKDKLAVVDQHLADGVLVVGDNQFSLNMLEMFETVAACIPTSKLGSVAEGKRRVLSNATKHVIVAAIIVKSARDAPLAAAKPAIIIDIAETSRMDRAGRIDSDRAVIPEPTRRYLVDIRINRSFNIIGELKQTIVGKTIGYVEMAVAR